MQNRYPSIVCQQEAYLPELVRYIHVNPRRAGRGKKREEWGRYPWSGHGAWIGTCKRRWQEKGMSFSRLAQTKGGRSEPTWGLWRRVDPECGRVPGPV